MKHFLNFSILLLLLISFCNAQQQEYDASILKAELLFSKKDFKNAAIEYSNAFKTPGWKGQPQDRFNAAIAWTLIGKNDSAFFNLYRLAQKTRFLDYQMLISENDLTPLYNGKRWSDLLRLVNPNNEIYNDSLAFILTKIYDNDQVYRLSMDSIRSYFGKLSTEYKDLISSMSKQDSLNQIVVLQIIDNYGWMSMNEIGKKGNSALWLVIQHAQLEIQEKYYPIMQAAVVNNKASKTDLAYLQDRILIRQGKKQLYGTQYKIDSVSKVMKLWKIEDPENLNKRRETIGLSPMQTGN